MNDNQIDNETKKHSLDLKAKYKLNDVYKIGVFNEILEEVPYLFILMTSGAEFINPLKKIYKKDGILITKNKNRYYFTPASADSFYLVKEISKDKYVILIDDEEFGNWEQYTNKDKNTFTLDEVNNITEKFSEYQKYNWSTPREMFSSENEWEKFIERLLNKNREKIEELIEMLKEKSEKIN